MWDWEHWRKLQVSLPSLHSWHRSSSALVVDELSLDLSSIVLYKQLVDMHSRKNDFFYQSPYHDLPNHVSLRT